MTRLTSLTQIESLYVSRGGLNYGEHVTQLEHALQCASLAQAAHATPEMIVAALLHDIGHLFEAEDGVTGATTDHRHELAGAAALAGLFGAAVCEPIALHVAAKRYLCFKEAGYLSALSPASQRSLQLQGGMFDAAEAQAFEQLPYWRDAVALRRFDDTGKCAELSRRAFVEFVPLMRRLARDGAP